MELVPPLGLRVHEERQLASLQHWLKTPMAGIPEYCEPLAQNLKLIAAQKCVLEEVQAVCFREQDELIVSTHRQAVHEKAQAWGVNIGAKRDDGGHKVHFLQWVDTTW